MEALLTVAVLCLFWGSAQCSSQNVVQPRSWAAARQHDGLSRPTARSDAFKPSLQRTQVGAEEHLCANSLPEAPELGVDQTQDHCIPDGPSAHQQDCAYPISLTVTHCLALLVGILLGVTVMRGFDLTLMQAKAASATKTIPSTQEVGTQVDEQLSGEGTSSSAPYTHIQHSTPARSGGEPGQATADFHHSSNDSTAPGHLAPAGCMAEDKEEAQGCIALESSSEAQASSHGQGLQDCSMEQEAGVSSPQGLSRPARKQPPEPPDAAPCSSSVVSSSAQHTMQADTPGQQQQSPHTGPSNAQTSSDGQQALHTHPHVSSSPPSSELATAPAAAGPLSVPGHSSHVEPILIEFRFQGSPAALARALEPYVGPTFRWLREASQVVGHAAHALGHLSEQAPKAVQALEKVGTGIERLLQVQQLRSQQAVAARCVSLGLYVMTGLLVVGSFRWGRLATIAGRCSLVSRTAVPDGPPQAAAWKRVIGLSLAEQMLDPWQHMWAWFRRTLVGCYIHELGAWAVGAAALWQLLPLCYRLAGRRLEHTWQVDIPLLLGGVVGTGGYYLVDLLGGNSPAWLGLWVTWCVVSLSMFLWTKQGWMARTVAGLSVILFIPGFAGLVPFMHSIQY